MLVCTNFNAFFMLKFLKKFEKFGLLSALDIHVEIVKTHFVQLIFTSKLLLVYSPEAWLKVRHWGEAVIKVHKETETDILKKVLCCWL